MTVPSIPRFDDFEFELISASGALLCRLNRYIISISGKLLPGVTTHRLDSAQVTIALDGTAGETIDFDTIQFVRITPYGLGEHAVWGILGKPKTGYSSEGAFDKVDMQIVGVEYLLRSRVAFDDGGYVQSGHADDVAHELVTAMFSGVDCDANSREFGWGTLSVTGNHGAAPSVADYPMTGEFVLDIINGLAKGRDFDFELRTTIGASGLEFNFDTAYPRGGTDRSQSNTDGNVPVVINDIANTSPQGTFFRDWFGMSNAVYGDQHENIVTDATSIAAWGRWESRAQPANEDKLETILAERAIKKGQDWEWESSTRVGPCRWLEEFFLGDKITHANRRMQLDAADEKVEGIKFSFPDGVLQLELLFGDDEVKKASKSARGGTGPESNPEVYNIYLPEYDTPTYVGGANTEGTGHHIVREDHIHKFVIQGDTPTEVLPSSGVITIEGDGTTATVTEDAPAHKLVVAALPSGVCLWLYNSVTGYYYTRYAADQYDVNVIIGKNAAPSAKLHIYQSGGVYLYMEGGVNTAIGDDGSVGVWKAVSNVSLSVRPNGGATETLHINNLGMAVSNAQDLRMYSGAAFAGTLRFEVDGATANTTWIAAALMSWEGIAYRMPTVAPAGCDYLRAPSGGSSPWQLEWATPIYVQDAEPTDTCPHIWIDTDETPSHALWSRNGGSSYLYPTTAGDSVYVKDDGNVTKFSVAGSDGDTAWADGALLTLESVVYRAPVDAPAADEVLTIKAVNGTVELEWSAIVTTDELVAVDAVATPGYLGAAAGDGVLRTSSPLSFTDGGNFVTIGLTVPGVNTNILYNNATALGAIAGFVYDAAGTAIELHGLSLEVHSA